MIKKLKVPDFAQKAIRPAGVGHDATEATLPSDTFRVLPIENPLVKLCQNDPSRRVRIKNVTAHPNRFTGRRARSI